MARMAFEDAHLAAEMGQADPGRQPRHARADDDGVVHGATREGQLTFRNPIPQIRSKSRQPAVKSPDKSTIWKPDKVQDKRPMSHSRYRIGTIRSL